MRCNKILCSASGTTTGKGPGNTPGTPVQTPSFHLPNKKPGVHARLFIWRAIVDAIATIMRSEMSIRLTKLSPELQQDKL